MTSPDNEPETIVGLSADPDDASTRMDTAVAQPKMFGRYRRIRELGRGGGGVVLLAHDEVLDIPVALKLVPEMVVNDTEGIVDLKKEVLRGMALTHPGIVRVYSFEQDAASAAIVMEYVEGETLADVKMRQSGRCFDSDEVQVWLEQLCSALGYAHTDARIAHRDLKPRNIMVATNGRLKIADFGIASSLTDAVSRISVRADSSGTPPYMSPQQVMGERPSHLDDIYSLGATIYELLTGKPPFFRGDILAQVLHEEAPSMTGRRAELGVSGRKPIPEKWEQLVAACLAKQAELRPRNASDVLDFLKRQPDRQPSSSASKPAEVVALPPIIRVPAVAESERPAVVADRIFARGHRASPEPMQWPRTLLSVILAAVCTAGGIHGVRKWIASGVGNPMNRQPEVPASSASQVSNAGQFQQPSATGATESGKRANTPAHGRLITGRLDQPPEPVLPRRGPRPGPPRQRPPDE